MQFPGRITGSEFGAMVARELPRNIGEVRVMRLATEIIAALAATVLVFCLTASSAAFAAGRAAVSADALSCAFAVPQNASPAARCAAIKRQCGGKFWAKDCSGRLLSAG
jgi:hypothetical protein